MEERTVRGTCHYCHKKGHREAECRTKLNDNANNVAEEHALMTSYCANNDNAEMWIGDTGATVIWKEFRDMSKHGVWVNVKRSSVPEGRKLIGSKWVFKENVTEDFERD